MLFFTKALIIPGRGRDGMKARGGRARVATSKQLSAMTDWVGWLGASLNSIKVNVTLWRRGWEGRDLRGGEDEFQNVFYPEGWSTIMETREGRYLNVTKEVTMICTLTGYKFLHTLCLL